MNEIEILEYTTQYPLTLIGKLSGVCYGIKESTPEKDRQRGINCLNNQHMRTAEFPSVYLIISGYSARMIRELYTHIGGLPTRLQESTRYIDFSNGFDYIVPPSIKNEEALKCYHSLMEQISKSYQKLINDYKIPKEDVANILPLGMTSKISYKVNLRTLIDMSHQRMCFRAYWEFREFFKDLCYSLSMYSEEWDYIVRNYFKPKCEYLHGCPEKNSCGYYKK